jgi:hypothetical protein
MLFKEIIPVYTANHSKHLQSVDFLIHKSGGKYRYHWAAKVEASGTTFLFPRIAILLMIYIMFKTYFHVYYLPVGSDRYSDSVHITPSHKHKFGSPECKGQRPGTFFFNF